MAATATILVVDDNPTNLSFLCEALETAGYAVRVAASGADALVSVQAAPPDLILLDIQMPEPNGHEVCRRLKADPHTLAIPIIFLTALAGDLDEAAGLALGAADYVTKPIRIEVALARITTHLRINSLHQALAERNAMLDAYASMVAHDLKNPLAAVLTTSNFLLTMPPERTLEEVGPYLTLVQQASRRSIAMINELLTYARSVPAEFVLEPLEMHALVARVKDQVALLLTAYRGEVVSPDHWPIALGIPGLVELVWINLISNALKYGGPAPMVELGAEEQPDGMARFWVRDHGSGIAPESLARVFDEQKRLHVGQAEGHGLGLAGVKRLVERLSGAVGATSMPGAGSTFFFTLPLAPENHVGGAVQPQLRPHDAVLP